MEDLTALKMDWSILMRRLVEVLQTIGVMKHLYCVGQRVEYVSQMDHGLDHHPIV